MDRGRLIWTLEGYGVGPRLCELLETFWVHQKEVPQQNSFHGPAFPATRVTTQGGLVSPELFNVVVDNAIQTWLSMTVEYKRVSLDRVGENFGRCLGVLYANDGMVGSRDSDWLQHLMNVLIGLFRQYGLTANVSKYRTMKSQPGALRLGISEEAKELKCTRVGYYY